MTLLKKVATTRPGAIIALVVALVVAGVLAASHFSDTAAASEPTVPASIQSHLGDVGIGVANLDPSLFAFPTTAADAIREATSQFTCPSAGPPTAYFVSLTNTDSGSVSASPVNPDAPPAFTPEAVGRPVWMVTIPGVQVPVMRPLRAATTHPHGRLRRHGHVRRIVAASASTTVVENLCVFVDPLSGKYFHAVTIRP